jgi:hypothetical protein
VESLDDLKELDDEDLEKLNAAATSKLKKIKAKKFIKALHDLAGGGGGASETKLVVMSCPEVGTIDPYGAAPYDQRVMDKVAELQQRGILKMGFDRAGSSTAVPEVRFCPLCAHFSPTFHPPFAHFSPTFCSPFAGFSHFKLTTLIFRMKIVVRTSLCSNPETPSRSSRPSGFTATAPLPRPRSGWSPKTSRVCSTSSASRADRSLSLRRRCDALFVAFGCSSTK